MNFILQPSHQSLGFVVVGEAQRELFINAATGRCDLAEPLRPPRNGYEVTVRGHEEIDADAAIKLAATIGREARAAELLSPFDKQSV